MQTHAHPLSDFTPADADECIAFGGSGRDLLEYLGVPVLTPARMLVERVLPSYAWSMLDEPTQHELTECIMKK